MQTTISEPRFKPEDRYLNPRYWYGAAVPAGMISPVGLGQTCWYVVLERIDDMRLVFAAETPEAATAAANGFLRGSRLVSR
jgi:hypothetical protein